MERSALLEMYAMVLDFVLRFINAQETPNAGVTDVTMQLEIV